MKILIVVIFLASSSVVFSQHTFIKPFKLGSYYEYVFEEPGSVFRYSSKIVSDTIMNGKNYFKMDVYNEPPMVLHFLYFYFDSLSLTIFGGEYPRCPDTSGDMIAIGFNFPIGYIFNDCPMGAYFKSTLLDKGVATGVFNTQDTLRYAIRKDTLGVPIEGTTFYEYAEKFGYVNFYRGYGSPLQGGPYSKSMVGAIIDGVRYGSILLDIHKVPDEVPSNYKLEQNFPNPFNPSTIIKFSLIKSSFVNLTVYDQLGRDIVTLVNEKKSAGVYQYVFNANGISSGIYYYRLQANDFIETKSMMLFK